MLQISTDKIYEILKISSDIENQEINGISTDSRNIQYGNLYVPIVGEKFNGHDFISDSLSKGAFAALCKKQEFEKRKAELESLKDKLIIVKDTQAAYFKIMSYWKSKFTNLLTFGIGGTVGKTTTKELLRHICQSSGKTVYTKQNLNTALGMCIAVNEIDKDTKFLVCEMGTDSFGEITTEAQIVNPDFGVCLNVGPTHAELLGGTVEGVAKAESELVQCFKDKGFIILNIDNEFVEKMKTIVISGNLVSMSKTQKSTDIFVDSYEFTDEGLFLNLNISRNIFVPKLFGDGNVYNVMAAVTLAKLGGIQDNKIKEGLKNYVPEKGRLNIFNIKKDIVIQDDAYNANLDSMIQSINVANTLAKDKKKIFVLGDMLELGVHSKECHEKLADYLYENTPDILYYFGDYKELIKNKLCDKKIDIRLYPKINEDNIKDVMDFLDTILLPNSWILFKASKGVGIWKLVDEIKTRYQQ